MYVVFGKYAKTKISGNLLTSSFSLAVPSYCLLRDSSSASIFVRLSACRLYRHAAKNIFVIA